MTLDADPEKLDPLVQAARQGDKQALGQLLRRLWPWIRKKAGYLVSRSSAPIGVSTLTQETALRLSRSIRTLRGDGSPAVKMLLTRIINNTAISAHRSASRRKRDSGNLTFEDLWPQPQESAEQQLERAELEKLVLVAIERLPDAQRQAVDLLRAGASYTEIASRLGCSLNAVHMRLQRAKDELNQVFRELNSPSAEARPPHGPRRLSK